MSCTLPQCTCPDSASDYSENVHLLVDWLDFDKSSRKEIALCCNSFW